MSRLISFELCLARPGSLLIDHLQQVKLSMESYHNEDRQELVKLISLAGICHDLGKAHTDWQRYINSRNITKGPNHSACGAFIFSYLGYYLLDDLNLWEVFRVKWLWLIRDIADHHSTLKDLSEDNWISLYAWDQFDLVGMERFIHSLYSNLSSVRLTKANLENWIDELDNLIDEVRDDLDLGYQSWESLPLMIRLQTWRRMTTSLIAGDRFDVRHINTKWLSVEQHLRHDRYIEEYCVKQSNHNLFHVRVSAQTEIMEQLKQRSDHTFYTLEMPTGYGKTITALKIATWFGREQGYEKIVYIAPYLSILEQTSKVIEDALGEKVLEHHSLAILDGEERTGDNQLAMESWAHSIVCTSFQQFSKSIFPRRSQDVLRRSFFKNSIVIIDEPQIFSPDVWNLFLCGLEALASLVNLKVIFLSATMPPFKYGLKHVPTRLEVKSLIDNDRYELNIEGQHDEGSIVSYMLEHERDSQALIMNTIEDAYRAYKELGNDAAHLLHGLMTPFHKKILLEKIKRETELDRDSPLYVVSTQVLEAGVDLSFQHVARALPLMPSIVQAAGRVNRHLEGINKGLVTIFPFYRGGEKDTRSYIYPKSLQRITDRLLFEKTIWNESELSILVKRYYDEMFRQNTYESSLVKVRNAYEGRWTEVSDFHPFEEAYLRLPLFVPWDPSEEDDELIPKSILHLQNRFQVFGGKEVYERYEEQSYMSSLNFEERKQFMILFNFYVLNLPVNRALKVASKEDYLQQRIPFLYDNNAYDFKIGLKAPFEEFDNFI